MQFDKNDQVICKILSYIPQRYAFKVEEIASHTRGWVYFEHNKEGILQMKDAFHNGRTLPLYFHKYNGDSPLFSYKKIEDDTTLLASDSKTEMLDPELTISLSFSNVKEFNTSLFNALYNILGETIDNDEKYQIAKHLLKINRKLKIRKELAIDLFKISNSIYQTRFWSEDLLPFFSNTCIKRIWRDSNDEDKRRIMKRLGIPMSPITERLVESHFEDIEEVILKNIISAQSSLYVCVAWFTNFNIFKAMRHKLETGIRIVLITNNDLINNGGYCLNFNELIEKGMELHLAEYPDLIHHKFCIIDQKKVITGSYNWTFLSENINRENIIVIQNDDVISSFTKEFNFLCNKYTSVVEMPETVPNKPEYNRNSFKQYISEELILRSKKHIGNVKENILAAQRLSPTYSPVIQAISDFHITEDNSTLTIERIDKTATNLAIDERRKEICTLNRQQKSLSERKHTLKKQSEIIAIQEDEIAAKVQQIGNKNEVSEQIPSDAKESLILKSKELESRQKQIAEAISQIEHESSCIATSITQNETEITTIQNTAKIPTKGGRGSLKINLKWNTIDDLDLHVIDPDGIEIYYKLKEHRCNGVLGQLDVDANASAPYTKYPQENIFWEYGKQAPIGHYKVFVELYSKRDIADDINFTVTIYPEKGESKVFTGTAKVDKAHCDIVEFNYTDNGISYL